MPLVERTVNSARNPKWSNPRQTQVELEVDFDELDDEYVPFLADPNDIVSWGPDLFNRAVAGEFGPIPPFEVPANTTQEESLELIRAMRDSILESEVDPVVSNPLRWSSMTPEKQQEWADYRQALLNLPVTNASAHMSYSMETESLEWVGLTMPQKPQS